MVLTPERRALLPGSRLPLAYFAIAHLAFGLGCALLVRRPDLPGAHFYHPHMVAAVHLVTVGWIAASILGSFYIVAPLALRLAMPVGVLDWAAWAAFTMGLAALVSHFWMSAYEGMAWAGVLVASAIAWVGARAIGGLRAAVIPRAVAAHVGLAFANMVAAAALGVAIGFGRSRGGFGLAPLPAAFTHAHLAAVGFALMMVVGLGYRLIPMMLPAAMPKGPRLWLSAIFLEVGLVLVAWGLLASSLALPIGAVSIAAGFVSFSRVLRGVLAHRVPKPPALPGRDWSTWQTHAALGWLGVAMVLGLTLTVVPAGRGSVIVAWIYGTAGLIGFLAQIIVGMQGRLVPLYAYYRAMAERDGEPPLRAANELPAARFARPLFLAWTVGVPCVAVGLSVGVPTLTRLGSSVLLAATAINAAYLGHLVRRAGEGG